MQKMPLGERRSVRVPADWFARATVLPGCCARHGRPAAHRVSFDLRSRPDSTIGRSASPLSTAARLADMASRTKVTTLRDWPLCGTCHRTHRGLRLAAGVLCWGGLLAFVVPIVLRVATGELQPQLIWAMLGGVAAVLGSAFVFALSGLARLLGAQTTVDGAAVLFTKAHPDFARELDALVR